MSQRFHRSLYEEHLEEISALYEHRLDLLDDPEIELDDVIDLEERLEAHLDALVVGAEAALELAAERAEGDDAGEIFGAIALLCRQGRRDRFEAALARFDGASADEVDEAEQADEADETDEIDASEPTPDDALADALRFEGPADWQPLSERLLAGSSPAVRAAVAVRAARQPALGPALVAAVEQGGERLEPLLWALGRIRERSAPTVLSHHAQRLDTDASPVATLALLRFGDPSVIDFVIRMVPSHPWAASLLAICGGAPHGPLLRSRLDRAEVEAEELLAAGLFGDVEVVPRLLECLEQGLHPDATAQALYLLTGASVVETVVVPVESIDGAPNEPDELDESAEPEPAEPEPAEPDPRDLQQIVRLDQDPAAWRQWWEEHRAAFERGKRVRLGQLASPAVLGATLHRFVLRRPVRQLAAEELGLRYRPAHDLDVDMRAGAQLAALAGLPALRDRDAVLARADGAWVFARALVR